MRGELLNVVLAKKLRRLFPLGTETVVPSRVVDVGSYVTLPEGFHGTNPSIVKMKNGYLLCVRGVNYVFPKDNFKRVTFTVGDRLRTINKFAVLDHDFQMVAPVASLDDVYDDIEDIKICAFNERMIGMGTYTGGLQEDGKKEIAVVEFTTEFQPIRRMVIPSPFGFDVEKNWAPCVVDGVLHFVYSFSPLIVLRYDPDHPGSTSVVAGGDIDERNFDFLTGGSSAGIHVPEGYLFATHRRRFHVPSLSYNYVNRIYLIDRHFKIAAASNYYVLNENAVQFVNGMEQDGPDLIISFGWRDRSAYVCRVPRSRLRLEAVGRPAGSFRARCV